MDKAPGTDTLNIAIDFPSADGPIPSALTVNIHTIVNGVAKETLPISVAINSSGHNFTDFWNSIGVEIEKHMRENPDYFPFGS